MAGLPGFAEIVHLHQSMVYSLAYHSLENRALAEMVPAVVVQVTTPLTVNC